MPSYKSHSIHGEILLNNIDKKVDIDNEDIKTFCLGFDPLCFSDYQLFDYQHMRCTKLYFETLLKNIKDLNLMDNEEVMAFVYGQLDHCALDITTHPLIYYMTYGKRRKHLLDEHALLELKIDDYISRKYGISDNRYYKKRKINDINLKQLINETYKKVFHKNNVVWKYNIGIRYIRLFDELIKNNKILITPIVSKMFNVGDIKYDGDFSKISSYLNNDHNVWTNPITSEEYSYSFDDLWNESLIFAEETMEDVNNYLYGSKPLNAKIITDDLSLNSALPCEVQQKLVYVKKY